MPLREGLQGRSHACYYHSRIPTHSIRRPHFEDHLRPIEPGPSHAGAPPQFLHPAGLPLLPCLLALVAGCAIGSRNTYPATAPARPVTDPPVEFVLEDSTAGVPGTSAAGCRGRLRDPRNETRLILRSSQGGAVGDYEVPPGRYGVGASEYLRVDCRTLRPIGAVPRPG